MNLFRLPCLAAGVSFETALPLWLWLLIGFVCLLAAGYGYHRLQGPRSLRLLCAGVRAVLLLVICLLLAGPQRVIRNDIVTPYSVGVLVDQSGSMGFVDVIEGDAVVSRGASIQTALKDRSTEWLDDTIDERQLRWFGATTTAAPLTSPAPGSSPLNPTSATPPQTINAESIDALSAQSASSGGTALPGALDSAWGLMAAEPVGAVVVLSDGRSQQPVTEAWLDAMKRRGVPVVAVPVGPKEPLTDLALQQVVSPAQAYVGDPVPMVVRLQQLGGEPIDPVGVTVRLVDVETGDVVDERTHEGVAIGDPIELVANHQGHPDASDPTLATSGAFGGDISSGGGRQVYRVEAVLTGEKVTANNREEVAVTWVDDPIQVLYIEAYPRWEYRYLASALTREQSVESSMLLVAAARAGEGRFVQEGDKPIQRVPNTARELSPYDVVIIGDVPVTAFSQEQLDMLRAHVADEGAGLIFLGGPEEMPVAWASSPLSALLPMKQPSGVREMSLSSAGHLMRPTDYASQVGVMRLSGPDVAAEDDAQGWPNVLSPLLYAQHLGELKPAVTALATLHPFGGNPLSPVLGDGQPLITMMPFGGGSVVYAGTDETWRFRRGRGGLYFEQYWIQLVRALGKKRVQQTGAGRAALTVSDKRVAPGSPVAVSLRLMDPELIDRRMAEASLTVTQAKEQAGSDAQTLRLASQALPMDTSQLASQRLEGIWTPREPGRYVLSMGGSLSALALEQVVTVVEDTPEMNDTRTDHLALERLAEATGGVVLPLSKLNTLPAVLETLGVPKTLVQTDEMRRPLWHGFLPWIVVLGLLTAEWTLRKVARLV